MADNKDDLLGSWLKKRQERNESKASERNAGSDDVPQEDYSGDDPVTDGRHLSPPILSGKLAEYLATQPARHIDKLEDDMTSQVVSFEVHDVETRAALALSLVLTSHITRFAKTTLSETALCKARDQLLRTFSAHDAVRIEVEAYDLLNWFAGAMNDAWSVSTSVTSTIDEAQCLKNHLVMIERAIADHRDLEMRYYTGTRGGFSTRRITPIELNAEKYMIAYCHSRKENRLFRVSRILSLSWIDLDQTEPPVPSVESLNKQEGRNELSSEAELSLEITPELKMESLNSCASLPKCSDTPSQEAMYAEDEDDLRALTAEGSTPRLPIVDKDTFDPFEGSVAVVMKSGAWVPESFAESRASQCSAAIQKTLPGIAAPVEDKKPFKPKNKKDGARFLPGFE